MKFIVPLSMAALAGLSTATPIAANKRASPLTIELTSVGNSAVKAVLTNTGSEDLNLLKTGTILDEQATEKVQVHNAKGKLAFNGVRLRVATTGLAQENFTPLLAGQVMELDIEVAALHDLSDGGDFDIVSDGALPYAIGNSTELTGTAMPFFSNKLSIKVDGVKASRVPPAIKRSKVQADCTGDELTATNNALTNCAKLATAAAAAAQSDSTLFNIYFKSSSNVEEVVSRLEAVAKECSTLNSGVTTSSCTDSQRACSNGVLAYTLPSTGLVVNCPLFFSGLSALSTRCHGQDQATTTLHEMTHANAVFSPGTDDLGYGFSAATALSASQSINNADSYALFANAVQVGTSCGASSNPSNGGGSVSSAAPISSIRASSTRAASTPIASTPIASTPVATPNPTPSATRTRRTRTRTRQASTPTSVADDAPATSETPDTFPIFSTPSVPVSFPTATGVVPSPSGNASLPSFTLVPSSLPSSVPTSSPTTPTLPVEGMTWEQLMEFIKQWLSGQGGVSGKTNSKAAHQH